MSHRPSSLLLASFCGALVLCLLSPLRADPPPAVEEQPDGVVLTTADGLLKVQVCTENIVRIAFSKDPAFFTHPSLMLDPKRTDGALWTVDADADHATVKTAKLQVRVALPSGTVSFLDASGGAILAEAPGGRTLESAQIEGEPTSHVGQVWQANDDESLYGMGEHHLGLVDIKVYDLDLWQHNGSAAIPFLMSSRGYGILWDNASFTRFGDRRQPEDIPPSELLDADGNPGGLSATYFTGPDYKLRVATRTESVLDVKPVHGERTSNSALFPGLPEGNLLVRWDGFIVPAQGGDHTFHAYSDGGIKVWIDGRLVINHWRQSWLPWKDEARVSLTAGQRTPVRIEWTKDTGAPTFRFRWKTPAPSPDTSIWSEAGAGVDYYFVYGPELDDVIAGYRHLTGPAPMMPQWAYGLWQSRQRYKAAQESIDVVRGYRERHIPFDNIVQDWFYWPRTGWGSHGFDSDRFPDPAGWVDSSTRCTPT